MSAANQAKLALVKISKFIEQNSNRQNGYAYLCGFVHDECICEIPGKCTLNVIKSLEKTRSTGKGKFFIPVYDVDDQAKWWGEKIQKCMEDAQTETFGGVITGAASFEPAPYWNH